MSSLRWPLLLILVSSGLSCSKMTTDQSQSFRFSIGPDAPYVLPIGLRSCKAESEASSDTDLSANTFEFTRFVYQWSGTGTYTMSAIIIRFTSGLLSSGKYECTLAGDEMTLMLSAGGRVLSPLETDEQTNRCPIRCGGIKVSTSVQSATIPGKIKVIGIETDSDGNSKPLVVESDIRLTYEKF